MLVEEMGDTEDGRKAIAFLIGLAHRHGEPEIGAKLIMLVGEAAVRTEEGDISTGSWQITVERTG